MRYPKTFTNQIPSLQDCLDRTQGQDPRMFKQRKGRQEICRPFEILIVFLCSDEPFNVLLRTSTRNRRSNNELHVETSISWTSPPFLTYILSILPPLCQEKIKICSSQISLFPQFHPDCPQSGPHKAPEGIYPGHGKVKRTYLLDHGMINLTTMIRTMRINNLLIQMFPIRSE